MDTEDKKYYIRLKSERIEVTKEVYEAYYSMQRKAAYQTERDYRHDLLYYDAWDSERTNGAEYIPDVNFDTENEALKRLDREDFWKYIDRIDNKYHICRLIAMGKTEQEISEIIGISQQAVSKAKRRLFAKLKKIFEKN